MNKKIIVLAFILVSLFIVSFINYSDNSEKPAIGEWCVELLCDGKLFTVTVLATGQEDSRTVAKRLYPKCYPKALPKKGKCK